MKAALRKIDDLREWFFEMKMPFWSLWNGFSKEIKERAAYNNDISNLEESWDQLENHLRRKTSTGGRVTIFITEKFGSPNGVTEYLELQSTSNGNAIAGIPNADPYTIAGKSLEVHISEQVNAKIESYEKDRKIKDLEEQLAAKNEGSGLNKILNRVADELPVDQVVMALISFFTGKIATTAISGIHAKDENLEETNELSDEQALIINNALTRIMNTFPDIPDFLTKLADWIEKNPAMAKSLLSKI
jgi:hypothetical protein